MKNVLFIVYYFPPMGGSGVQRPLKFVKYLRDYGWNPIILCPDPGAYHTFDDSMNNELEQLNLDIHRVAGNTPLHFAGNKRISLPPIIENSLRKVSTFFWLPDNKTGWIQPGFEKAIQLIKEHNIEVVFSTAAPYSNLMLAAQLKSQLDVKVVMDLRDEWLESHLIHYPSPWHKKRMAQIEKDTLVHADVITVINQAYKDSFGARFPKNEIKLVTQGFDPADFEESSISNNSKKLKILYSGLFYGQRTPENFLTAFKNLSDRNPELKEWVELQFQGGLSEETNQLVSRLGLQNTITDFGYVDHKTAVQNLMDADVLWLMVGHLKNAEKVTVGKMFEYFGAQKPVLALIPEGDSMTLLNEYGASYYAHPSNTSDIESALEKICTDFTNDQLPKPDTSFVARFNRKKIAGELAQIFNVISR